MAVPLVPMSSVPINGPPGYNGGVYVIGANLAAGDNIAAAAGNGAYQGAVLLNPQALGGALGSVGSFSDGGSGGTGGQDGPGSYGFNSGLSGSGGQPPAPADCMTCTQIKNSIHPEDCASTPFFDQPFCDDCDCTKKMQSPATRKMSGGPEAGNFLAVT